MFRYGHYNGHDTRNSQVFPENVKVSIGAYPVLRFRRWLSSLLQILLSQEDQPASSRGAFHIARCDRSRAA
jgi:hypothetical protein